MIRQALVAIGMTVGLVGFVVICISVNIALSGNFDLTPAGWGPTWW